MKQAYGIGNLDEYSILNMDTLEAMVEEAQSKVSSKSSKRLTPAKYKRRIHALRFWQTGDSQYTSAKNFGAAYKDCKNLKKLGFYVVTNPAGEHTLWKSDPQDPKNKQRVVHILETFSIIREHHVGAAHYMSDTTKKLIDNHGYYNITRSEVKAFVDTCPQCNMASKNTKPAYVGAKIHITSEAFRSLFQVDLIDYREDRQIDLCGVPKAWMLVLKDHNTRFLVCQDLPDKSAKHVARFLFWFCNIFGYPHWASCASWGGKTLPCPCPWSPCPFLSLSCAASSS